MERRHDHVIVQLSAHEMQRTRMLRVLGRFVADQLLPSEVSVYSYTVGSANRKIEFHGFFS